MKLSEVVVDHPQFKIFCDLDGVLADFEKMAMKVIGHMPSESDKQATSKFWADVRAHLDAGHPFFETMDMMPDAQQLWDYIVPHHPIVLSSTGKRLTGVSEAKYSWVQQHLGDEYAKTALFTPSAQAKAAYAGQNHILIDDRNKAIAPWIAAGGIGILHTSAANTIRQLKELGL